MYVLLFYLISIKTIYTTRMSSREKVLLIVLGCITLLACGVWYAIWEQRTQVQQVPVLSVSFLNVGQGDSIFIEAPNGNQMLIDGGRDGEVLRQLGKEMRWYDKSIDVVIATHPDFDHIGGLDEVLSRFAVSYVVKSGVQTDKETEDIFDDSVNNENATTSIALRGQKIFLDTTENIYFEVLSPDRDVSTWETNDASIVGKLVYGSTCFILTGDAPKHIEDYLVALENKNIENDLDCQVLKAGHHGSRTSSGERFVQAVTPDFAVVSAGKDNSYGHPHKEVVEVFNKYSIPMLTTFEQGTITFVSDGKNVLRK